MPDAQLDYDSVTSSDPWAERCEYWLHDFESAVPYRKRRDRQDTPLVLCGHGLSLRVDSDSLLIRDGNTHYPAEERSWRYFKGALDIPSRIVVVDGSGDVTLDALRWIAEQKVSLVLLTWDGSSSSVQSQSGYVADPQKVRWQQQIIDDPDKRLRHAKEIIVQKLKSSITTLEQCFEASSKRDKVVMALQDKLAELKPRKLSRLSDLLGLEGGAAVLYFSVWTELEINWKGLKRWPVPGDWQEYISRSSLTGGVEIQNKNASHPVNAMLNYAYSMLYRHVLINVVAEGYDPNIGVMHKKSRRSSRHEYVLDVMEPLRPVVDRAILELTASQTFTGRDFQLQTNGVCRLNPQLARRVVQVASQHLSANSVVSVDGLIER